MLPYFVAFFIAAVAAAQTVPPVEQCEATFERQGANSLLSQFAPCQNGITEQCCKRSQSIVGLTEGAPLGGCLCHKRLYDELATEIDSNSLARAVGVTSKGVQDALQQCGVPYAYGTGDSECPSDGGGGVDEAEGEGNDDGGNEDEGEEDEEGDVEEEEKEEEQDEGKETKDDKGANRSSSSEKHSKGSRRHSSKHRRGPFRPNLTLPKIANLPEPPKFPTSAVLPIGSGGIAQAVGYQAIDTVTRPAQLLFDKGRK